ncbi:hypothetical protein N9E38_01990 [Yoonia sp.]|nr:hypothetical protein [Yoonia sp.]
MLLKLIATASLIAGLTFAVMGVVNGDIWATLPLAINGIIGFAVLMALSDIVDYLADISAKVSK